MTPVVLGSGVTMSACTNPLTYPCGCHAWNELVRVNPLSERVSRLEWQHREHHCQKHQETGP